MPATMPTTAESSDHQKPGACRIQKVVTSPTTPEIKNSQPIRMVKAIVAIIGTRIAATPRTRSTMPSIRNNIQCSRIALSTARSMPAAPFD